jgi:hypothetical protein
MLPVSWLTCGVAVVAAAWRSCRRRAAIRTGRTAVFVLYVGAGAVVNAFFLLRGDDYAKFADGSYISFVRETWRSLVVPNHHAFIAVLIAFEASVGLLALMGGRRTQVAYGAAIAFHVALLSFGWGFYLWSVPMIAALVTLLRQERAPTEAHLLPLPHTSAQYETQRGSVDLYWIPLGAGARSVRFNGVVYEAIAAGLGRRERQHLYHSALSIDLPSGHYVVEMTPVPDGFGASRGVVAEGPVGLRAAGQVRLFRYEIRRWRDGIVPDLSYAVASPVRLTNDPLTAQLVFDLLPLVPTATWGRDELAAGEMWTCNSVISWVLDTAGIDLATVALPTHARAPGWDAGLVMSARARCGPSCQPGASIPQGPFTRAALGLSSKRAALLSRRDG